MSRLAVAQYLNGEQLFEIQSRWDRIMFFNEDRNAIQILDCNDPEFIGGHLPLAEKQAADFRNARALAVEVGEED